MPLRNFIILLGAAAFSLLCYSQATRNRDLDLIAEAMTQVRTHALEEIDRREIFEGAVRGIVQSADDPYSAYISPADLARFEESLNQEFGGIGIMVELGPKTGRLTVMSPLVGTPAYRAGIQAGDVIAAIDGQSTRDMRLADSVEIMRGEAGTPVDLTLLRATRSEPLEIRVHRAVITIESVLGDGRSTDGTWNFFLEDHPRIGYIRLTNFGEYSVEELTQAIARYQQHPIDGLILDLRDNAGGLLNAAVDICDMFIDSGKIVSTKDRQKNVIHSYRAKASSTLLPAKTPVVVLVNGFSASASEIVAACLQDHARAEIVGERSFGKGTVQNIIPFEGGASAIKLTTASYWRPSDRNIHRGAGVDESGEWGVTPDEEMTVSLSDEASIKIRLLRRDRDIIRAVEQVDAPDSEDSTEIDPLEEELEKDEQAAKMKQWSDDPQLQKAIEVIEQTVK